MNFPMLLERRCFRRKDTWIKSPDKLNNIYYIGFRRGKNMEIHRGASEGFIVGKIEFPPTEQT
jgi:hypothetical protein